MHNQDTLLILWHMHIVMRGLLVPLVQCRWLRCDCELRYQLCGQILEICLSGLMQPLT
jgi:hypothetical protein